MCLGFMSYRPPPTHPPRTFKQNYTVQLLHPPDFFVSCLGKPRGSPGGSGGFGHGCKTGTSAKDLDPGVAFVVGWEIGTVASLGDVWNLGTGVSFP